MGAALFSEGAALTETDRNPESGDQEITTLEQELARATNREERLRLSLELARRLARHGAYDRAIPALEPALELAESGDDRIRVLRQLGEAYMRLSQYQKAYVYLGEALTQLSQGPSSADLFQVYYDIAWMYYRQGYLDNARSYLEGARMVIEGLPPEAMSRQRAELLHITGLIEAAAGNHDLAAAHFHQEIGLHQKTGDERWLAAAYNKLSSVTYTQGRLAEALGYQEITHSLAQKTDDSFRLALSHKNYGDIYFIGGDLAAALDHYRRSLDICHRLGNGLGQVFALAAIGRITAWEHQPAAAKGYFDQALEMARNLENADREACILVDLAQWHLQQSRPESALESLKLSGNIEMMRGQSPSPRHQVVLARALLLSDSLSVAASAQRVLDKLLERPLPLDDEQMTAIPELEAEARFLLSRAYAKQGFEDKAHFQLARARELLRDMSRLLPENMRDLFLAKPLAAEIMGV